MKYFAVLNILLSISLIEPYVYWISIIPELVHLLVGYVSRENKHTQNPTVFNIISVSSNVEIIQTTSFKMSL
jgi:hypothetical protein